MDLPKRENQVSPKSKDIILKALSQVIGDDFYRARQSFSRYTESQLDSKFGDSGKTCREILAEAQEHYDSVAQAIRDVEKIHVDG